TINTTRDSVGSIEQRSQADVQKRNTSIANDMFDKLDSEKFGKTQDIKIDANGFFDRKDQKVKVRKEVLGVAEIFADRGMSWETAMQEALAWSKGKSSDKKARAGLVKDLNSRKKKFTARPTHKHTKKTFATKDEEAESTMSEIYEKAGIQPD
ncbi:hypothetical protein LCGC14_2493010, partial [marine sediment metagenome]